MSIVLYFTSLITFRSLRSTVPQLPSFSQMKYKTPLSALSGCELPFFRMRPPSNSGLIIAVTLWPFYVLLGFCRSYHRHGPAEAAGFDGGLLVLKPTVNYQRR